MIQGFWNAIPAGTFQDLSTNLFCSTLFSAINCPPHKSRQKNVMKIAGLILLAKAIETFILATWKMLQDEACRRLQKEPEPLTREIKIAAAIASWVVIINLQTSLHPRTIFIALVTSLPTALLR